MRYQCGKSLRLLLLFSWSWSIVCFLFFITSPYFSLKAYAQGSYCGTICDPTHSCGSPVTITGRIIDQNGKGVAGLHVILYDNNRNNINYPVSSAYTTLTTDQTGTFSSNSFICGEPTINYGDSYAVRPDWSGCIFGYGCFNPTPASIENQQALKLSANPQQTDCGTNGGCQFTVALALTNTADDSSSSFPAILSTMTPYAIFGALFYYIIF